MAKAKCKLVRVCSDEVVLKKAHLREDIREAKAGIRRDEHELGLRGLGSMHVPRCARGEIPVCTPRHMVPGLSGLGAMRKVSNITADTSVYRDSDSGEYVARTKGHPENDYFTDIRNDAESTALEMAGVQPQNVPVNVHMALLGKVIPTIGRWTIINGSLAFALAAPQQEHRSFIFAEEFLEGQRWFRRSPVERAPNAFDRIDLMPDSVVGVSIALDAFRERVHPNLKGLKGR